MDKKTILVVTVCLLAIIAWYKVVDVIAPPPPKRQPPTVAAGTNATPAAGATSAVPPAVTTIAPAPAPAEATAEKSTEEPAAPLPPEELVVLQNHFVRATVTSWGGGLKSIELLTQRSTGTNNLVLNAGSPAPALALVNLPGAGTNAAFSVERTGDDSVTLRAHTPDGVEVTKQLTLGKDYLFSGAISIRRPSTNAAVEPTANVFIGMATPADAAELPTYLGVDWLVGTKTKSCGLKQAEKGPQHESTNACWAAVKSQFFAQIITPVSNAVAVSYQKVDLPTPPGWKAKQPPQGLSASLTLTPTLRQADGTEVYRFAYFAGPKEFKRLAALSQGQEEVMQFGWFSVICIALLRSMNFFYALIPNYGIAILLITVVIKIIFWPVQAMSIRSMKQMQKFQPLMQKLREKYKDDPQRMNQEMMKLYKEHKINPFAGCLPMLVQIPVFFAFYTMLRSAVELRGARFLWIHDLSKPDTIAQIAGFGVNPLPLLMGVTMIWQMKLSPSGGDPKQQQMMMFMPLVFLFMCYNMASGLVLYWTMQQLLSIGQQWWSLRQTESAALPAGKPK